MNNENNLGYIDLIRGMFRFSMNPIPAQREKKTEKKIRLDHPGLISKTITNIMSLFIKWFLWLPAAAGFFTPSQAATVNLVLNGSFETGLRNWTYHTMLAGKEKYGAADFAIKPEIDLSTAALGKASVKAAIPAGIYNEELHKVYFWFRSGLAEVKPDTTYTLSFYGKSSKPVHLEARVYDGFKIYTHFINEGINLTTEWKRYTCSGKSIGKFVWIEFADYKCDDCAWWIDGVQLEEGGQASDFKPAREVEVGCESPQIHNLYKPGERVDVKICLSKNDNKAGDYEIAYATEEALTGKILGAKKDTASFQVDTPRLEKSMPYELKSDRKGIFKTTVTVTDKKSGKTIDADDYIYGVFDPLPPAEQYQEDSIFAVDHLVGGSNNRDSVDAYFKMASEVGARWFRCEDFSFAAVNPQKGVFCFDDSLLKVAEKHKIGMMVTLGVELGWSYIPRWARTDRYMKPNWRYVGLWFNQGWGALREAGRTVNLDALYGYAYETVKHFQGRIKYWEIFNECYSYPDYPAYLNTMHRAIKDADPEAITIMNVMRNEIGTLKRRIKRQKEYENFDVLSLHIYQMPGTTTAPDKCRPSLAKIIAEARACLRDCGVEKPVWDTEGGYYSKSYYTKRMTPGSYIRSQGIREWIRTGSWFFPESVSAREQQVLAAAYNVRKYVIYLHENIGKYFYFVFNHLGHIGPYPSLLEYDDTPKLAYIAYGQMARMLEGACPLGKPALPEGLAGYIFRKDGRLIGVFWRGDNKKTAYAVPDNIPKLQAWDMVGNELKIAKEGNKFILPLGAAPIYVAVTEVSEHSFISALESGRGE